MAKISKSRLGRVAEHYAIQWLLNQGYQVFHNVHHAGPIDLVILDNDKLIPIDVKTESHRKNKNLKEYQTKIFRSPTQRQKKIGVRILYVDINNKCYWGKSVKDN